MEMGALFETYTGESDVLKLYEQKRYQYTSRHDFTHELLHLRLVQAG